jgi:antitoxin FitA
MTSNEEIHMATVTIKNIPDELYQKLKSTAEINYRSINSEIIKCIENSVISHPINPENMIANARALRKLTERHPINDRLFNEAKTQSRL